MNKKYKLNHFNFRKLNNNYLITNDFGNHSMLNEKEFNKLINCEKLPHLTDKTLMLDRFIYYEDDEEFAKYNYNNLRNYKSYIEDATVLHIFVVSKNCNYNCVYCQAGNLKNGKDMLMSEEIARKSVDIAFESPSKYLTFEFQGGEPLTNFDIIKYIVDYSMQKNNCLNESHKKNIEFLIVSNLSLLTNEMINYIIENDISICTSIDGNSALQNINRPFLQGDSYSATVNSIKKLQENEINVSALLTTTKYSLKEYESIVDEYIKLGLDRICVRPLTILGKAKNNWTTIGYNAEEFVDFYKNVLNYIIDKNKAGIFIKEGMAEIFLEKIVKNESLNYMELRSPCGGAIGQLAYYYDGEVFTCDEGRMLSEMGDNRFKLGNVFEDNYITLMKNNTIEDVCKGSCLESLLQCHSCAYMPYCGTCPVANYVETNHIDCKKVNNYKCIINKGMLDVIFELIYNDKKAFKVFKSWI